MRLDTIDLDAIPRVYATGNLVVKTEIGWVHIIRGEAPDNVWDFRVPRGPVEYPAPPSLATDIAIRQHADHVEIMGHLGRSFTVAYQGHAHTIPDNCWIEIW